MNFRVIGLGALCCATAWPSFAEGELSANLAVTSDYVWRGISQTLGDPAIQGGIDYAHESGVYVGAWASNVDFFSSNAPDSTPDDDDDAGIELDLYVGYSGETEFGFGWDLGVIQYRYPGARKSLLDTSEEFYAGASYRFFNVMVYRDFDNDSSYVEAGLEFELPQAFTLNLRGGHFDFDDAQDYTDYGIALSRSLAGFDVSVQYTDTDLSDSACAEGYWFDDLCDGAFSVTVAREFEL